MLAELGLTTMTPIQAGAIPVLLQGRDLSGQSKTGSGKTLAFALPLLQLNRLDQRVLQSLVLCPTRELCAQVAREFRKLGRRLPGLQVQILAGGPPLRVQTASMAQGLHIAVATPGRLLDHLRRGTVSLEHLRRLVLDEADRMLDMGFAGEIRDILAQAPKNRQTIYFSATMEAALQEMSSLFQRNPVRLTIDHKTDLPPQIQQVFYEVDEVSHKAATLSRLLQQLNPKSALVFCHLKATVAELAHQLSHIGLAADALHGDLEQAERDRAMALFRNGSTRVLVATDVAARGLDVNELDVVVNYDLPGLPEVYLHRIGRTGRAGQTGLALNLGLSREHSKLDLYEKTTGTPVERVAPGQHSPNLACNLNSAPAMTTLHIWAGRQQKMRPGDILGALTGDIGLDKADVGKIEILDRISYVAVSSQLARGAAEKLRAGSIKGRKVRVDVV